MKILRKSLVMGRDYLFRGGLHRMMQSPTIRLLYYTKKRNFGDMLNRDMFRWAGKKIVCASVKYAQAMCIGSMLQEVCAVRPCRLLSLEPLHVFGTGFIDDYEDGWDFVRPLVVHSLRGELTRRVCEGILQRNLSNVPLGDPGLLVGRMYSNCLSVPQGEDIGIVCHLVDTDSSLLSKIKLKKYKARLIDIRQNCFDFVREIASCRCIFSSAMHPLICADSLNVPNRRVKMCGVLRGGDFKFDDYYSVFSDKSRGESVVDLRVEELTDEKVESLLSDWKTVNEEIDAICDALLAVFRHEFLVGEGALC